MYPQMLINETEANRDVAFVKRRRIIQATKFTIEQLKDILSDESKMLGLPDMSGPKALGVPTGPPTVEEPKARAVDLRQLMGDNHDR